MLGARLRRLSTRECEGGGVVLGDGNFSYKAHIIIGKMKFGCGESLIGGSKLRLFRFVFSGIVRQLVYKTSVRSLV